MFGGTLLKWWTSTITSSHFWEESNPWICFSRCHPLIGTLLQQIPSLPYLLLALLILFFSMLQFSLPWFFCGAFTAWTLKINHCPFKGPLGVSSQFVFLNFKNFEEFVQTIIIVLCSFILQLFKLETFFSVNQGEFIVDYINRVDKTNYLFLFWVFEHEDDYCQLVNANLQPMDGHFFLWIFRYHFWWNGTLSKIHVQA